MDPGKAAPGGAASAPRKPPAIPPAEPPVLHAAIYLGVADFLQLFLPMFTYFFSAVWFLAASWWFHYTCQNLLFVPHYWSCLEVFSSSAVAFHVECTGLRQILGRHLVPLLIFSFTFQLPGPYAPMSSLWRNTIWFSNSEKAFNRFNTHSLHFLAN